MDDAGKLRVMVIVRVRVRLRLRFRYGMICQGRRRGIVLV
jgi:hypothetical protein